MADTPAEPRSLRVQDAIEAMARDWCHWCQVRPATELDHLIPRSRGGSDDPENLAPSCSACNSRKRDKTPAEYGAWLLKRAHTMANTCPRCGQGPGEWCLELRGLRRGEHRRAASLHPERRP